MCGKNSSFVLDCKKMFFFFMNPVMDDASKFGCTRQGNTAEKIRLSADQDANSTLLKNNRNSPPATRMFRNTRYSPQSIPSRSNHLDETTSSVPSSRTQYSLGKWSNTTLSYRSLRMSTSHFMMIWKGVSRNPLPVKLAGTTHSRSNNVWRRQ